MNPNEKSNTNEPQVISPQWQYTSGQLSQQNTLSQQSPQPAQVPIAQPQTVPAQPTQPIASVERTTPANPQVPPDDYQEPAAAEQPQPSVQENGAIISWEASEFSSTEKNGNWYLLLGLGALVFAIITFLLTKQIFSVIVIVIMSVAVGVYASIKPRTLNYAIGETGIRIGEKYYRFDEFKSFGILDDMAVPSLHLVPIKKLMMPITIYVAPDELDKVAETLGSYLPYEEKKRDFTDKLSHRLRF